MGEMYSLRKFIRCFFTLKIVLYFSANDSFVSFAEVYERVFAVKIAL